MSKIVSLLSHPDEIVPLGRMYLAARKATKLPKDEDLAFCYGILNVVSRSFAIVIQQLPNPLRDAICVFYLVLRGLDTVEDDMAISVEEKVPALLSFHTDIYQLGFTKSCGTDHYKHLMENFDIVVRAFLALDKPFQAVIADITKQMGTGMAEFIEKEVRSLTDYNLYCHYVAGLVGIGLSQLFASSGLEDPALHEMGDLSNEMGLFLQKTNIIRDYLEDIMEEPAPRMFWPRAVWGAYVCALEDLKLAQKRPQALHCLNHMIMDALQHMPQCLEYMRQIKHPDVFKFCAIPQVMAAGTLALCYNNGKLFEGVVKMRRGQTAKIFGEMSDLGALYTWFLRSLEVLRAKVEDDVDSADPTREAVLKLVKENTQTCQEALAEWTKEHKPAAAVVGSRDYLLLLTAGTWCHSVWGWGSGQLPAIIAGPWAAALRAWPVAGRLQAALLPLLQVWPGVQRTLATVLMMLFLWRVVAGKRGV